MPKRKSNSREGGFHVSIVRRSAARALSDSKIREAVGHVLRCVGVRGCDLEVVILGAAGIQRLNERWLGHPGPTDVIAFDLGDGRRGWAAGQVNVCWPIAQREARRRGVKAPAELLLYMVHGLLHLLGYDDTSEAAAARMHRKEDRILGEAGVRAGIRGRDGQRSVRAVQGVAILVGIGLLSASMLFAALSVALREMSRVRLEERLEGRGRADLVDRLFARREELILAVAMARTLAHLALGFVVLWLFMIGGYAASLGTLAASFGIAAAIVMVFGVVLPHVWAEYAGEALIARAATVLLAMGVPFRPLVAAREGLDNLVRRLSGRRPDPDEAIAEIEQEILDAVSEGEAQGHMAEDEKEMIVSAIELRDQHVTEIMTPRIEVIAVEVRSSLEDIKRLIAEQGYSRMPVYEESLDNVLGILNTKDLLTLNAAQPFDIRQVMRKAIFVPDMKTVRGLLREFQKQKTKIAIVLDEYGGTAGVVTTTDIYEELVGDIEDEEDVPPEHPEIVRIDENTSEIDARLRVDEFNEEFDVHLPDGEGYDTVGGLILSRLGRIPKVGEKLDDRRAADHGADGGRAPDQPGAGAHREAERDGQGRGEAVAWPSSRTARSAFAGTTTARPAKC